MHETACTAQLPDVEVEVSADLRTMDVMLDETRVKQILYGGLSLARKRGAAGQPIRLRAFTAPPAGAPLGTPPSELTFDIRYTHERGAPLLGTKSSDASSEGPFASSAASDSDASEGLEVEGTSLTSAIAKEIAKLLNATLSHTRVARGSQLRAFTLCIPDFKSVIRTRASATADAASMQSNSGRDVGLGDLAGQRVLVVDDVPVNVKLAKLMLQRMGAIVDTETDPRNVKTDVASLSQYDAIMLDIVMPHMSGIQLCQAIKEQGTTIPMVACTGNTAEMDVASYMQVGFTAVLQKPFSAADVLEIFQALHLQAKTSTSVSLREAAGGPV